MPLPFTEFGLYKQSLGTWSLQLFNRIHGFSYYLPFTLDFLIFYLESFALDFAHFKMVDLVGALSLEYLDPIENLKQKLYAK